MLAPVGTLERGLSILGFYKTMAEASITDVADAIGLSRSTTYRIAERLRELGFLEINPVSGRWRLGREAVQLGVVALQSTDIMQVAPELLRALLQMAGEAVNLAVFDADGMVLLYREQGPQSITISSRLGSHRPMHASSLGKAFLSAMADNERHVLLGRIQLKRYTDSTITSLAALERDLAETRRRGYSIDRSEFEVHARLLRGGGLRPSRPAGCRDQRVGTGRARHASVRTYRLAGRRYGAGNLRTPRPHRARLTHRLRSVISLTIAGQFSSLSK